MNNEEKAAYYAEISRLNKIISIVIEQNDLLKLEIQHLKTYIGQTENELPYSKLWNRQTEAGLPDTNILIGQTGTKISNTKTHIGQTEFGLSNSNFSIGQTENTMPDAKSGVGQTEAGLPNAKISVGQTQQLKPLPDLLSADITYTTLLANVLKRNDLKYLTRRSTLNAARLFIHFYNKSRSDYPTLRNLTGLSQGGLSKFMTSLRRRKLIQGAGWQKYAPTSRVLQFMQQALN